MSEFSTEELIKTLKASNFSWIFKSEADAIVAKLRAADRLCEAAKRADCLHWDELNKAIADYEGKP